MAEKRQIKVVTSDGLVQVYPQTTASQVIEESNIKMMTAAERTKLSGVEAGAQVNDIESIKLNGVAQTITDKAVDLTVPLGDYIPVAQKAVASGVASLDANGKVPLTQINDSVLGQVEYLGQWNASTGAATTDLRSPSGRAYRKGDYFICATAGNNVPNLNGTSGSLTHSKSYAVGDWIIFTAGSDVNAWDKVDNTDAVSSVAGRTGVVVLSKSDVGLGNVDNTADSAKTVGTAANVSTNINGKAISAIFESNGITVKNATAANKLAANKTLTVTGDASGSVSTDLSGDASLAVTLANSGVSAGTYSVVTADAKGRVTAGGQIVEFGTSGQTTPSATLAVGGLFFELQS